MSNDYCKMLWDKHHEAEIKKFLSTKKPITGYEKRGEVAWKIAPKNHYKCYSCGATAINDEPWIHYNNIPDCSSKPFVKY